MARPKKHRFQLPLAVRQAVRCRKEAWISEWAARRRRWVETPGRSGWWDNDANPKAPGILDALGFPSVKEVINLAPPQDGKSEIALTWIAWILDQDPAPFMYVMQTDQDASDMGENRMKAMFEKTPWLKRQAVFSGRESWNGALPLTTTWGWLTSGQSVSRLASKPVKYLSLDEEEKYPKDFKSKGETNAVNLSLRRQESFSRPVALRGCTPTDDTGSLTQAYLSAAVRFIFVSPCPHCGTEQLMDPKKLLAPEEYKDNPDAVEELGLGFYQCVHCQEPWSQHDRDVSMSQATWVVGDAPWAAEDVTPHPQEGMELRAYLRKFRPVRVGFWSWRGQRVGQSFSKIVARRIRAKGDKEALHDYLNGDIAQPWRDFTSRRTSDQLKPLRLSEEHGGLPMGLVPGNGQTAALVATVDTQDDWFKFEIRAFGYGLTRPSWGVRCGVVDLDMLAANPFEALEEILWGTEYKDADGNIYPLRLVLIDSGGHRTTEVYDWGRLHKGYGVRVLKGGSKTMRNPFISSRLDTYPPDKNGVRRPIPGGLDLWWLKVDHYKEQLAYMLQRRHDDPGAWIFSHEYPDSWLDEMASETKNAKGDWVKLPGRRNEAWDLSVYMVAAEDMLKVRLWKKPEAGQQAVGQRPEGRRKKKKKGINPYARGGGYSR